ncbi:hypothetical protein F4677DRAFT_212783 [Hypoxylon crocopeplum]|nr:hypothetical protein F4677DRAFT_212783 [Hypoxylon crocopeplum]
MSKLNEWKVELIIADDKGCRFYLDHYKPFRLAALKQDPYAFGSTYDREICFTDDDWLSRIKSPLAKTFVAVFPPDEKVLSATSLIGPLPNADPASNPFQVGSEMGDGGDQHRDHEEASPVSFQISGVYTAPEARGQGVAKAVVKAAAEQAAKYAKQRGKQLALSVVVYASNTAAIAFYETCSFVVSTKGPRESFNPHKNSRADELCMHYHQVS